MNKGFKKYYKESFKNSNKALKKNYIYYFIFNVFCLFAYTTVVLAPLAIVARIKLVKMINKEQKLDVLQSFDNTDRPISYWKLIISSYAQFFLIFSGAVVILLSALIMASVGYGITLLTGQTYLLIAILFSVPSLILLIVYLFIASIRVIPAPYLVEINPDIDISIILKNSLLALKYNGKGTNFVNNLVYFLIEIPMILIITLIGFYAFEFADTYLTIGLGFIGFVLVILVYCFVSPRFTLAYLGVRTSLFNDMIDAAPMDKRIVKGFDNNEKQNKNNNDELLKLFNKDEKEINNKENTNDKKNKKHKPKKKIIISDKSNEKNDESINSDQIDKSKDNVDNEAVINQTLEDYKETEGVNDSIENNQNEAINNNSLNINDFKKDNDVTEVSYNVNDVDLSSNDNKEAEESIPPENTEELTSEENIEAINNQEAEVSISPENTEELVNEENTEATDNQESEVSISSENAEELTSEDNDDEIDDEVEELLNSIPNKDNENDEVDEMLNSIPEASDDNVLYVDEDGNPIDSSDDVIYVDEDGNPIKHEEE